MAEPNKRFVQGEQWSEIKFVDLFEPLNNNTLSRDNLNYEEGEVRNIHYGDVLITFGDVCDVTGSDVPIVNEGVNTERFARLQDGDIIMADTAEDETVGKVTEIENSEGVEVISGLHTIACRPKFEFAKGYLGYYLNTSQYHDQLWRLKQGTKVYSVSRNLIADTIIRYPEKEEQEKIVAVLRKADELIATTEEEIANLEQQKKAAMQAIFSRKVRFKKEDGSNFPEWEEFSFEQLASRSSEKHNPQKDENQKCIELEHINQNVGTLNGYTDSEKQSSTKNVFHKGNVLFGKLRPYLRKYYLCDFEGVCSSEIWVLIASDNILPEYLFYVVNSEEFIAVANKAEGTKMPRAEWGNVSQSKYTIPVDKCEQKLIADFLTSFDEAIAAAREELEKYKELKKGLLQQMFV